MMFEITGPNIIRGQITIPGDKSISHRAVIISAISSKKVFIDNFLFSEDCENTIDIFRKLGVNISAEKNTIIVDGVNIKNLHEPDDILYVGNSGTSIRLVSGLLTASSFMSVLSGDSSINRRPMKRIIEPLKKMGADIYGRDHDSKAPLVIFGKKKLKALRHELSVASAQVKSSIILASLFADGITEINQPAVSRDHTERMLEYFGLDIKYDGRNTIINPKCSLEGKDLFVPNDISSAAYFIVAALILNKSKILLKDIGINPTRSYFLKILQDMGGNIIIRNKRVKNNEEIADIECFSSDLKAITIKKEMIPNIIDEIPILSVAAAFADGETEISGAEELRYKESDRINTINQEFRKTGIDIKEKKDGLIIKGNRNMILNNALLDSHNDHRIAMSSMILALKSPHKITVTNTDCIKTSFPNFNKILFNALSKEGI
jgi:3-phosphoshikimate 1-carboxyvinyltransferase